MLLVVIHRTNKGQFFFFWYVLYWCLVQRKRNSASFVEAPTVHYSCHFLWKRTSASTLLRFILPSLHSARSTADTSLSSHVLRCHWMSPGVFALFASSGSVSPKSMQRLCSMQHAITNLLIQSTVWSSRYISCRNLFFRLPNAFSIVTMVAENLPLNSCWVLVSPP